MFRSRRTSLTSILALLATFLPAIAGAQLVGPKMIIDTPSDCLAEARHLGNVTGFGPGVFTIGANWMVRGGLLQQGREGGGMAPPGDVVSVWQDENAFPSHRVPPHLEGPNPNPLDRTLTVDEKDFKGGFWSVGTKVSLDFVQHWTHWDMYLQNLSAIQVAGVDILYWNWALLGMHLYRREFMCALGGSLGDGGLSMDHLGSMVAVADTLDNVLHVSGVVNGVAASSVVSATVRAGPNGPAISGIGLQSLGDDGDGALTIHAQYLGFAHADVPALLQHAYLEIVTTQGVVVGGYLSAVPESNVAAVVPAPLTNRLVLEPLSPNPASRELALHYDVPAALSGQRVQLSIHDVLGRLVRTIDRGAADAGDGAMTVDLRGDGGPLTAGLYFVTLRVGTHTATRRFIVAH